MNRPRPFGEAEYCAIEQTVGYTFRDKKLLLTAFTHSSLAKAEGERDNERLEFLGDAVLELVVTEMLFLSSRADEGKLTELRKQYVSQPALEQAEARLGLMQYLRYTGGENNIAGKTRSNLFEAVAGAIYLDGGLDAARKFLLANLVEIESENYKTLLQEYVRERRGRGRIHVHRYGAGKARHGAGHGQEGRRDGGREELALHIQRTRQQTNQRGKISEL